MEAVAPPAVSCDHRARKRAARRDRTATAWLVADAMTLALRRRLDPDGPGAPVSRDVTCLSCARSRARGPAGTIAESATATPDPLPRASPSSPPREMANAQTIGNAL